MKKRDSILLFVIIITAFPDKIRNTYYKILMILEELNFLSQEERKIKTQQ